MAVEGVVTMLSESVRRNWTLEALTDYKGATFTYGDIGRKVAKLHLLFEAAGIERGDKIAICGRNSSNWAVAFLAALTYGAVVVPILHEFKTDNIHNIINHSDARLVFVSGAIWELIDEENIRSVLGIIQLSDFSILLSRSEALDTARAQIETLFAERYPTPFGPSDIRYEEPDEEALAVLNYTSGTSGHAKGVMIPHRALTSNMQFAYGVVLLNPGDKVVSMLPMAHAYGMSFEFLWEMTLGAHVYFLTRTPSPKIIHQAFTDVRPNLIVAVPLIIEKIIKKGVLPRMGAFPMNVLVNIPVVNDAVHSSVREQVMRMFGGNFYEVIIGGAGFNKDVERFLHSIRFPYTVGYGSTECAPIICYEDWKTARPGSCGKAVINMEVRIDSEDPEHVAGEVLCRGKNVMLGYYKNEALTREVLDADGWYHTGDLGIMDSSGRLYIRGRSKNMILGPSGHNIYPEEIEDVLNTYPYVAESLIVERGNDLVALVYPDMERVTAEELSVDALQAVMDKNRKKLNKTLPVYSQISKITLQAEEFEKTPKKSIKRFLYQ